MPDSQLLEILQTKGVITQAQAGEVLTLQKTKGLPIDEILLKGGYANSEKLASIKAEMAGLAYVVLSEKEIDKQTFEILPEELARKYEAICFAVDGNKIKVATAKLDDFNTQEALEFWASGKGLYAELFICSKAGWQKQFSKHQSVGEEIAPVLSEATEIVETRRGASPEDVGDVGSGSIEEVIKSAPVSKIVSIIIKHAVENHASDIHIEPNDKDSRVRYRIDGMLHNALILPRTIHDSVVSRIKVLAKLQLDETRAPQDGRFKVKVGKKSVDLRVSTMPLLGKEKVSLRILDTTEGARSLEALGFSKHFVQLVDKEIAKPYGMVLVTGPTGSGKSTTIYSILNELNKEDVNIVTLEDPIEYYIGGVNQSQINPEVEFTFATGLRALLRQDPDIIMVGEIRDNETAEMAIHAGLTGHLLFSTLHTNNSVGAIPRLVDMKVEPFLLASVLNLVVAQRLARRICDKCREEVVIPKKVQDQIRKELENLPAKSLVETQKFASLQAELKVFKGKGCSACKNSGYKGRVVLAEVLPISEKMRKIISSGFKQDDVAAELARLKMTNLYQDGLMKALQGLTTLEEVMRVSAEVEEEVM